MDIDITRLKSGLDDYIEIDESYSFSNLKTLLHCLLAWLISDEMPPNHSFFVNNVFPLSPLPSLPPSTFMTLSPFITGCKQFGYDVPWHSFLYISYA